ncbi:glycosyltransferase family 2 protein [Rhabdothermincola salaria]|uniref:glycosyltransferase family 2 protein n=1 Tax=Rhabdothermincola salaria TaxID=2903142 RepID=UPI001E60AB0C|nr:glycosyltransferase [Rhabdothermincola salaria]
MSAGAGARPTVSVVIPTAGEHRRYRLQLALLSLQRQLLPDDHLEVVVVLDGEDPGDYVVVADVGLDVTLLAQPQAGPATARNTGWRATSGDVVAFLDDDVAVMPGWLDDLRTFFAEHPGVAAVGGTIEPLHPRNVVSRMMTDFGHLDHRRGPHGKRLLTANAAVRRPALEAVGGFDESFPLAAGEDMDLSDRLGRAGLVVTTTEGATVLHGHPRRPRSMVATARRYRAGGIRPDLDEQGSAPSRTPSGPSVVPGPATARPGASKRAVTAARRVVADRVHRPGRHPAVVDVVDLVVFGLPQLRHLPDLVAQARAGRTRPGPLTALVEALLELRWRVEFTRPAVRIERT